MFLLSKARRRQQNQLSHPERQLFRGEPCTVHSLYFQQLAASSNAVNGLLTARILMSPMQKKHAGSLLRLRAHA
jgi:hypothetical protein